MAEINPHEVYTTGEAQELLKISNSTIKRLLKRGLIRANKVGGNYRILGKELIRLVAPAIERDAVQAYRRLKKGVKNSLRSW